MGQVHERTDGDTRQLRSMISFGITDQSRSPAHCRLRWARQQPARGPHDGFDVRQSRCRTILAGGSMTRRLARRRLESTVYVGGLAPLDSTRGGIGISPAELVSLASGYASRSHYFWAGASHRTPPIRGSTRPVTSFSLVYGYRPPAWRNEYPKPDLRFFVEATGDITGASLHDGQPTDTDGRVVMMGPTLLLLYKAYAHRRRSCCFRCTNDTARSARGTISVRHELHLLLLPG